MSPSEPLHEVIREIGVMRAELMVQLARLETRADHHRRQLAEHTEADHQVFDTILKELAALKLQAALNEQAGAAAGKRTGAGMGAAVAGLFTLIVEGLRVFYAR